MSKKITHEQFMERFLNHGKYADKIELLGKYVNSETKIQCKCMVCGYEWGIKPGNLMRNGCPHCHTPRYTIDDVIKKGKELGITILATEYVDCYTKMPYICDCHPELGVQQTTMTSINQGMKNCKICRYDKAAKSQLADFKDVKAEFDKKGLILLDTEKDYINAKTPMRCICPKHKEQGVIMKSYDSMQLQKFGCMSCAYEHISEIKQTPDDEIKAIVEKQGLEFIKSYRVGRRTFVTLKCYNHSQPKEFTRDLGKLKAEGDFIKCPHCYKPKMEMRIEKFFNDNGIEYEAQKKFDDLRGLGDCRLSYDFYIPCINALCEAQGAQHTRSVNYFGGEEHFLKQVEHDKRKKEYALSHGYKFIEIMYYDFNNIEDILAKELNLEVKEVS